MWKKIAVTVLIVISLSVGTAYAENSLQTVYHVHVDGKPIGTVETKEEIHTYINRFIKEAEQSYEDWNLSVKEEVSFESEKVFSPAFESEKVMKKLKKELTIAVETVRLEINGDTVAHLSSQAKADQVIRNVKEKYVDPDVLEKVEQRKAAGREADVEEGETEVLDVRLTGLISFESQQVTPSQVQTIDEAVARIQTGEKLDRQTSENQLHHAKVSNLDLPRGGTGPLTDVVVHKEGIRTESIAHKVRVKNTDELYEGESKIKQQGEDGEKSIAFQTTVENGKKIKEEILKKEITKDPVEKIILKGTKKVPAKGTGDFEWPAVGGTLTSKQGERWGKYHKGVDIAGVKDRTIKAADHGEVIQAEYQNGFGNKVVINHKNGYETIYAHLSSIDVEAGQTVKRGEVLGMMGTTGHSTGIHLHFEIHKDGSLKNPLDYISK